MLPVGHTGRESRQPFVMALKAPKNHAQGLLKITHKDGRLVLMAPGPFQTPKVLGARIAGRAKRHESQAG
jgi:hypothetical protein